MNQAWACLMVEECLRNGVDTFFLAPGSRCTPLTLAVARNSEAHVVQHFDERGLGFAAVGYARATGRPGVVITTSGTAVSNLLPSVVEAHQDGIPMLLLTADRPPELRDCGANQSIDQLHHFGNYTEWFFDMPCPSIEIEPAMVLTTIDHAILRARTGPVHMNCPFREPLIPLDDGNPVSEVVAQLGDWEGSDQPYTTCTTATKQLDDAGVADLEDLVLASDRVLILAGGGLNESEALAVAQMAEKYQWPLIADVTSGLLFGPHREGLVRHSDSLVSEGRFPSALEPSVILQFGCRFLSKSLISALHQANIRVWLQATRRQARLDPEHRLTHRIQADIDRFCMQLEHADLPAAHPEWQLAWQSRDEAVAKAYEELLDHSQTLSEPAVVRAVSRFAPDLWGLMVSASMPIRDLNSFAAPNPRRVHVAANRGASGIDGTAATAVGFARGLGQGVTILTGDLAMLHDLNSLALVGKEALPVVIVVINNHGGGIFHFLPVSGMETHFEKFFGTPHHYHFSKAADMFGLEYEAPKTMAQFVSAYQGAIRNRRSTIIEVETERRANVEQHRALRESLKLKT